MSDRKRGDCVAIRRHNAQVQSKNCRLWNLPREPARNFAGERGETRDEAREATRPRPDQRPVANMATTRPL
jgi:hypothetical protein